MVFVTFIRSTDCDLPGTAFVNSITISPMKRKLYLLSLFFLGSAACFAQDVEKKVLKAAKSGYREYLNKIPQGQERNFGFRSRTEFNKVTIGKPYRVVTLKNEFFTGKIDPARNYLAATDEFRIPLLVNNDYRVLITIVKMNGAWQVVNIGSSGMASELGILERKHPSPSRSGLIMCVYRASCDFFLSSPDNSLANPTAYPFESAVLGLSIKDKNLPLSVNQLLPQIKALSEKNNN
jgi:hypothetical protein